MDIDWNETGKEGVITVLGEVPEIGGVLGFLTDQLWPSDDEDVWDDIRVQVQQLVGQMLSDAKVADLNNKLEGLRAGLADYQKELTNPTPATLQTAKEKWIALELIFRTTKDFNPAPAIPGEPDYRVLLLPQYAQFATLYLGLLRDGVVAGATWWTPEDLANCETELSDAITAAVAYTHQTYELGLAAKQQAAPVDAHGCEPFRTVNTYIREMTLAALDYVTIWPYMDPSAQLTPPTPLLTREIYSDPFGTADDSGAIRLPPSSPPSNAIDRVKVYGGSRIEGIEVLYYDNGGPGGVATTGQMGVSGEPFTALSPPNGGIAWVGPNKIQSVDVVGGDALEGFTLHTTDGGAQTYGQGGGTSLSYADHLVSSLFVNGVSTFYFGADTLVVGFMHKDALPDPPPS